MLCSYAEYPSIAECKHGEMIQVGVKGQVDIAKSRQGKTVILPANLSSPHAAGWPPSSSSSSSSSPSPSGRAAWHDAALEVAGAAIVAHVVAKRIRVVARRFEAGAQDVVVGSRLIEGRGGGGIGATIAGGGAAPAAAHCGANGTGVAGPAAGSAGCRLVLVLASGKEVLVPPINTNSLDYFVFFATFEAGQERACG